MDVVVDIGRQQDHLRDNRETWPLVTPRPAWYCCIRRLCPDWNARHAMACGPADAVEFDL